MDLSICLVYIVNCVFTVARQNCNWIFKVLAWIHRLFKLSSTKWQETQNQNVYNYFLINNAFWKCMSPFLIISVIGRKYVQDLITVVERMKWFFVSGSTVADQLLLRIGESKGIDALITPGRLITIPKVWKLSGQPL